MEITAASNTQEFVFKQDIFTLFYSLNLFTCRLETLDLHTYGGCTGTNRGEIHRSIYLLILNRTAS